MWQPVQPQPGYCVCLDRAWVVCSGAVSQPAPKSPMGSPRAGRNHAFGVHLFMLQIYMQFHAKFISVWKKTDLWYRGRRVLHSKACSNLRGRKFIQQVLWTIATGHGSKRNHLMLMHRWGWYYSGGDKKHNEKKMSCVCRVPWSIYVDESRMT